MTNGKFKRIVIASTAGAVLLLVILIFILVFQLTKIGIEQRRYNELVEQVELYKQLNKDGERTIEARTSYWWIVQRAREMGYIFDGDHVYVDKN